MANDDMKKMLLLIESCSCESNNEEELDEMFFFKDTRSREEQNRDANKPQDILGRRPEQAIAKHGKEYKAMKKGTSAQDAADRERYGLGGPEGPLPENFEAFIESIREMAGRQLDELKDKTYTDAGNARVAQAREIDNISLRGTGHGLHRPGDEFRVGDFPENTPQGRLAKRADKLLKHGEKKAIDAEKKSHVSPATARTIGLEEVEDVSTTKMSTAQEMAEKLFAENPNMTSDDVLDKGYELVLAQDGRGRADRLFHFNADFADELVDMYKQIKDEASNSTVESDDAEFQSFMETLNYVMRKK